ncbi:MAG: hypothetical protein V1754_11840 [Pseudomonadota bacterium]
MALHYWLASVANKNRLFALLIADSAGALIAASIRGPEAEELAAIAPLLNRKNSSGKKRVKKASVPMTTERIAIGGCSLYLCAVGDCRDHEIGLNQAAEGIHRILEKN